MRASLALLLSLVACYFVSASGHYIRRRSPATDEDGEKCTRLFQRRNRSWIHCSYFCKGWPIRREYEDDGSPCTTWFKGAGTCMNGRCVQNVGSRPDSGSTPGSSSESGVSPATEAEQEASGNEEGVPPQPEEEPAGPPGQTVPSDADTGCIACDSPDPVAEEAAPEQGLPSESEERQGPGPEQTVPNGPEQGPGEGLPDEPEPEQGTPLEPVAPNEPDQEAGETGQEVPAEPEQGPETAPEQEPSQPEEQPTSVHEYPNPPLAEEPLVGGPEEVPENEPEGEPAASSE